MSSSCPTTNAGKIINATPPRVIAALVVTLPIMAFSGGQANDAIPKTNIAKPTQTKPLRLESFAPNSRAVSFWAAPNSVPARVSSRSVTVEPNGVLEYWNGGVLVEAKNGMLEYWNGGKLVPAGTVYVRTLTVS